MSADKSKAARLADRLERPGYDAQKERDTTDAAAELRRLDALNAELLEALRGALDHWPIPSSICKDRAAYEAARAAVACAEEAAMPADTLPPLPEPMDYCYEWDGPWRTRKFSSNHYNGRTPDRSVALFRGDQMRAFRAEGVQALEAERDQLRAELAARKESDTRSTIAAWDQIKRLQGEARVLRDLLAEARQVLGTVDAEDAPDQMAALLAAIDAALDPTSREAQQMVIIEVAKNKASLG